MKSFALLNASSCSLSLVVKKLQNTIAGIVIGFFLTSMLASCYHSFYATDTRSSIDTNTIKQLRSQSKYFIIHFINSTNGFQPVNIKNDSLRGTVVQLPTWHGKYLYPNSGSVRNRVKSADKHETLLEVHLYTNLPAAPIGSEFSASLSSFNRVDVYELNKSATTTNYVLSSIGIGLAVVVVAIGVFGEYNPYGH